MAKARKKPETAGEQSPAVSPAAAPAKAQRYRFTRAHSHADVAYAAGDISPPLTQESADLIRRYAGADALTHVVE